MLLPMLASMQPTPLPATLLAEVMSEGTRVYGAVNAPGWVMPVAAACAGLIPVSFLALSKGAGSPAVAVEGASIGTDSTRSPIGTPRCGGDCGESECHPRPLATTHDRPRPPTAAS